MSAQLVASLSLRLRPRVQVPPCVLQYVDMNGNRKWSSVRRMGESRQYQPGARQFDSWDLKTADAGLEFRTRLGAGHAWDRHDERVPTQSYLLGGRPHPLVGRHCLGVDHLQRRRPGQIPRGRTLRTSITRTPFGLRLPRSHASRWSSKDKVWLPQPARSRSIGSVGLRACVDLDGVASDLPAASGRSLRVHEPVGTRPANAVVRRYQTPPSTLAIRRRGHASASSTSGNHRGWSGANASASSHARIRSLQRS